MLDLLLNSFFFFSLLTGVHHLVGVKLVNLVGPVDRVLNHEPTLVAGLFKLLMAGVGDVALKRFLILLKRLQRKINIIEHWGLDTLADNS